MPKFEVVSKYQPAGDQPKAIDALAMGVEMGLDEQTLLGVTGSGKTYTIAKLVERVQRPTLVLAHNKTLAAQLCSEFRELFPNNAVEYFVSYYDYYQPEAYIPSTDTYIEKDSSINDEIDRLRHSATSALFERRDVLIVASVSCIYSLGDPEEYTTLGISMRPGMALGRDNLLKRLTAIQYERNDMSFVRNTFRVRGDTVEIFPSYATQTALRVEFFGDEIDRVSEINALTGQVERRLNHAILFPASHYVSSPEKLEGAIREIQRELAEREQWFRENDKLIEAQRIHERTMYDCEMLGEIGFCSGIENYSRIISGRTPGSAPYTLLDYFPKDFLMVIDESHVTLPQVHSMYAGDHARKKALIDYGFRLPSAFDNRPLSFEEFEQKVGQVIYVSATPGDYELERSGQVVEQVIRPTGLVDPEVIVRPVANQVDDLIGELNACIARGSRALVTALTVKTTEDLTAYLVNVGIRAKYLNHQIETIERMKLIRELRMGEIDVLVGVNLLREGLDMPEVDLVAILDADREGFLRSGRSLIQIIGRAARNVNGRVVMYADRITDSMRYAIDETNRRRGLQMAFNEANGIVPKTIQKDVYDLIDITASEAKEEPERQMSARERMALIEKLRRNMRNAATMLEFEYAAQLRDRIAELEREQVSVKSTRDRGRQKR